MCVWNRTCIHFSPSLLSTPSLTTCAYHSFPPLPIPSSAFSRGVSILLSIAPFIMDYKYGSLFVVFLDVGSFILVFIALSFLCFLYFLLLLVLLFSQCFSPLIITTVQLANSTECTWHEVPYNNLKYCFS